MADKGKGTTASIVSVLVFVGCCGAMVADFQLWWLPLCALPLLIICNINYKGHWDSEKLDEAVEEEQLEEPYSRTWPFNVLEATPSKEELKALDEVREENAQAANRSTNEQIMNASEQSLPHHIDEDM